MTHRRFRVAIVGAFSILSLSILLMGWRSDEFVGRLLWLSGANDLPTDQHILEPPTIAWSQVRWSGDIQDPGLNESSGLAASNYQQNLLWSINDSGDGPNVFAMSTKGEALGRWQVDTGTPTDWEAMDSFVLEGEKYLLIADVGDNFARRETVSFVVVKEPQLNSEQTKPLSVEWRVEFSYPDGPRDCEAVAVDADRQQVLLVSKRTFPNELYSVPLRDGIGEQVIAQKLANLYPLPRNVSEHEKLYGEAAPFQGMPTGMSLRGNKLLVTTYRDAYLYDVRDVAKEPARIPLPLAGQREGIAFVGNSETIAYVSRERKNGTEVADLFRIDFAIAVLEQKLQAE